MLKWILCQFHMPFWQIVRFYPNGTYSMRCTKCGRHWHVGARD